MNEPQASAAIFCAIDTPSLDDAVGLARRLNGVIGGIKLGSVTMSRHRRRDASTLEAAKRRSYVPPSYESKY